MKQGNECVISKLCYLLKQSIIVENKSGKHESVFNKQGYKLFYENDIDTVINDKDTIVIIS